jgi:hypothetical protein
MVDDVEITRLVDTAIYYLEKYSAGNARGGNSGVNFVACLRKRRACNFMF